jgi:nucleotide-binding universal stress UspA family protein
LPATDRELKHKPASESERCEIIFKFLSNNENRGYIFNKGVKAEICIDDSNIFCSKEAFMENFKNILVISRMIPYSREAIKVGISLARKYDAKLIVLHLVSNPVDLMAVNAIGLFPDEEYKRYNNSLQEAKERLDKVIKQETLDGFPIKELTSDRDPLEEIVKVVKEEKTDLIVVSAHEEGRIEHALFGGENDAIIRKMPCSIMLVKK